ncbi:UMP kinase [Cucumibacter marinus]|uniref:UMP kinase n=1 Tax=Cucumibacter marinus TaxID=1121252 RepID=UPI0003F78641|nr:UMP kinase [Cucumibacter marinus]
MSTRPLKKILVKVSGEALAGDHSFGLEVKLLNIVATQLIEIANSGVQVAVVVGGGNIFRGMAVAAKGADRVVGDYMGMLSTVINALAIGDAVNQNGGKSKVFSNLDIPLVADNFTVRGARAAIEDGSIAVFGGGTGNPFFTTDTAAVLKAVELDCDAVIKATKVDGVYSEDPAINPDAERFDEISHDEVLRRGLRVMDMAAFAIARENNLPILVYALDSEGGLPAVLEGTARSTTIA